MNAIGFPLNLSHFAMLRGSEKILQRAQNSLAMRPRFFKWGSGDVTEGQIIVRPQRKDFTKASWVFAHERFPNMAEDVQIWRSHAPSSAVATWERPSHSTNDKFKSWVPLPLNSTERRWFADRADSSGTLVLVFSNIDYVGPLLNWLVQGRSSGVLGTNYAVVCYDEQLETLFRRQRGQCFRTPEMVKLSWLWKLRVRIITDLLDEGLNVISSDSDAFWLRSPMPALNKAASMGADIIASRGRSAFSGLRDIDWGTMCMGFAFFRATNETRSVMRELSRLTKSRVFDDQAGLNNLLKGKGLTFGEPVPFIGSSKLDMGRCGSGGASIALLPHQDFIRVCEEEISRLKQATVVHCPAAHAGATKEQSLRQQGLWFLRRDWETVGNNETMDEWLLSLRS